MSSAIATEVRRRRTFAIISHPDAGKTTLTEKLLLFGGAIQVAGAVKSNKIKKSTVSDFMEIERQRGISVATSVMSFEYSNILINLLDTPESRCDVLRGSTVDYSSNGLQFDGGSASDLANGRSVTVVGNPSAGGTRVAARRISFN